MHNGACNVHIPIDDVAVGEVDIVASEKKAVKEYICIAQACYHPKHLCE